jgi:predicted AlkP superfamily pyrophosphatase or phosphodiesterase
VGALAASPQAPELIWAEFLMTDTLQHYNGYKSELGHFSVEQADLALGRIMQRLANAGVADEWTIAVMSDHGHSHIETALHPQVIIPGVTVQCEGGSLLVAPKDQAELRMVEEKLAAYGVEAYPNDCVPPEYREQVYVFVAPYQTSFEGDNPQETEPTGKPKAISTHGLKPGWAGDHRFALFAGPAVPQGSLSAATATQVAPTLAKLLGLPVDGFAADPLF